jgi:ankyrin repeat protein
MTCVSWFGFLPPSLPSCRMAPLTLPQLPLPTNGDQDEKIVKKVFYALGATLINGIDMVVCGAARDQGYPILMMKFGLHLNRRYTDQELHILHLAAFRGNLFLVQWLMPRLGMDDIEATDKKGRDVYMHAAMGGHVDVMDFLLQIAVTSIDVPKLLRVAALYGNLELVMWFANQGVDLTVVTKKGRDIAFYAAIGGHIMVLHFLANYMYFDLEKDYGSMKYRLIHVAASQGHVHLVEWLYQQGYDIMAVDHHGRDAAVYATIGGHIPVLSFLHEVHGFRLDIPYTADKYQLLHVAAAYGRVEVMQWLMSNKHIDMYSKDIVGKDVAVYAAMYGQIQVLAFLKSQLFVAFLEPTTYTIDGYQLTHVAAYYGHVELLRWLIEDYLLGMDVMALDNTGKGVAAYAAFGGSTEVLAFLKGMKQF